MPSYYNRIKGTLEVAKLAKSSDIHLIQSSVQDAISNVITDMFGPSFVLGEAENDLKLVPTAIHVDQTNTNYNPEDQWISFYERYFKQPLFIEKSSIESITVHMINDSKIDVTVYAEIRDINYNLLKETNAKLIHTESDESREITFNFDLHHLGVGQYYFVLKPVDISAVDLALSGDEGTIETVEPEMFCVRYDKDGSYQQGLEASYNGVDYLDAYLLEEQIEYDNGDSYVTNENNFDLYFEHTFSSGNTYLINPGAAIVHGQKVYPIDTHVTIAGPSPKGDRTDLVVLTQGGFLNVVQGTTYNGTPKRPSSDTGLKIAYITSYKAENADWVCPSCQTTNDGNSSICYHCGSTVNTKVPLIEQADDNGMTRQRDVLERLRRLEKMMAYEQEYNRPTRIKYMCTNDPVIFQSADLLNNQYIDADSTYGMTTVMENGELINKPTSTSKPITKAWAIREKPEEEIIIPGYTQTTPGKLYVWDLINYHKKPKSVGYGNYITIRVEGSDGHGVQGIPVNVTVSGKGNKFTKQINTNKNGNIRINPYDHCYWSSGKYTITASHNGKSVKATYTIINETNSTSFNYLMGLNVVNADEYDALIKAAVNIDSTGQQLISADVWIGEINPKFSLDSLNKAKSKKEKQNMFKHLNIYTIKRHGSSIDIITAVIKDSSNYETLFDKDKVHAGDDSFHFENAYPDWDKGEFKIAKVKNLDDEYVTNPLASVENPSSEDTSVYKVYNNIKKLDSDYPVLDFHFEGGYVHSITPYIKKFRNIESFQIILFENDLTFGQSENHRISYQKKIENDENFPNIYVSPVVEVSAAAQTDSAGNKVLYEHHKFIVDKEIPKGNYSLLFYSKIAEGYEEGAVFVKEYDKGDNFGTATRVKGTCNPSLIYLETNNTTGRTWDIEIEKRSNQYKATGIVISKPITLEDKNYKIRSVKLEYNNDIPEGCDMTFQVSNDAGRNWVTAKTNLVTFSGNGNVFEWKVIMKGNGADTPVLKFSKSLGFAVRITLNTVTDDYVAYEDYGRCLLTPVMDFAAMTYKVFGDSTITQADFSEWEWARLFMDDEDRQNEIQILISNGNTDNNPIYTSSNIDTWNRNLFFHQAICGLTLNDFEHTSIDYSNYDPKLEPDEYNYRFKYDVDYGETIGSGEVVGNYKNAQAFQYYPTQIPTRFEPYDASTVPYNYQGNLGEIIGQYSGTHTVSEPYYGVRYRGPLNDDNSSSTKIYYNSDDDETYDRNHVLTAMLFENGLEIGDKYIDLSLDVFISMGSTDGRESKPESHYVYEDGKPQIETDTNGIEQFYDIGRTAPKWKLESPTYYFPSGTFELIVSFNPYGLMEDDMTYGKIYTINQNLYDQTYNKISIPLFDDFVGSTIYSIGIRAKDISNVAINKNNETTALRAGDIIGLGDLKLGGHDRKLYWPSQGKYAWKKGGIVDDENMTKQHSYASVLSYMNGAGRDVIFPLTSLNNYANDEGNTNVSDFRNINADATNTIETLVIDEATPKPQTKFVEKVSGTGADTGMGNPIRYLNVDEINQVRRDKIHIHEGYLTDGTHKTYLEFPEIIFNFLHEPAVREPSFYIDVDFNLDPYTWVRIEHWLEAEVLENAATISDTYNIDDGFSYITQLNTGTYTKTFGQIHSGDIVFEFYDTEDHTNSNVQPIETFTLPAWGRIQTRAKNHNKEVNAWFKIRNGGRVKRIVVKRKNPTGDKMCYPLRLHIYDIGMHREKTVPALGSQLQMRIYPKSGANENNTKIRKAGVVYRIA